MYFLLQRETGDKWVTRWHSESKQFLQAKCHYYVNVYKWGRKEDFKITKAKAGTKKYAELQQSEDDSCR